MYTRREMKQMSNEELNVIAQEKNKRRVATSQAKIAQEIIGERHFYTKEYLCDDYEGWIDYDDEEVQGHYDVVEMMDMNILEQEEVTEFIQMECILRF